MGGVGEAADAEARGIRQRALDLGAGGVAAGVHDPRQRVTALDRELEHAVTRVELRAELHELAHRRGPSVTSTCTASTSHSPAPATSVSVWCERARVGLVERRRDATLRVPRGRGGELALGDHARRAARRGRRGSRPRARRSRCPARGDPVIASRRTGRAVDLAGGVGTGSGASVMAAEPMGWPRERPVRDPHAEVGLDAVRPSRRSRRCR